MTVKYPAALCLTFLWIGFVVAISFVEAWLKFQAPGITLPLGLGIGRLVFSALNKMEWLCAVVILLSLFMGKAKIFSTAFLPFLIAFLILLAQSVWALPALDARAELYIMGTPPSASSLHFVYVGMEAVKVLCLAIFGVKLLK